MSDIYPAQVISQDALRWINFFNGRLLTGDDLTREQAANRDARQRLGQALGDGIAWGLQVQASPGDIILQVSAGEAVNRQGQVLCLGQPQAVSLLQAPRNENTTRVRQFNACEQTQTGGYTGDGGLYLLALCPGESVEDRAALSGLSSAAAACNSKYRVEGVQFKLILLSASVANEELFRNETAYEAFFAADAVSISLEVPFSKQDEIYGRLDGLRPDLLSDEDVPLALILRDPNGVVYVDNWSVRRRLRLNAHTPNTPWSLFLSDRRASEAEAIFLQFQEQLGDILRYESNKVSIPAMSAGERFKYLPPVGFLPTGGAYGFNWRLFLGSHAPVQATQVDAGVLDEILLTALQCQPFLVETAPLAPVDVFTTPENSFVMFARSRLGRLRLRFSAENGKIDEQVSGEAITDDAEAEKLNETLRAALREKAGGQEEAPAEKASRRAFLAISTSGSNLEIRIKPDDTTGDLVSPNLPPGTYRLTGSLAGLGALPTKTVKIVGGRVTTNYVPTTSLKPGYINLDAGSFRLCLVPGTFADAAKQMKAVPWARAGMVEIGVKNQGGITEEVAELKSVTATKDGALMKEVLDRLALWKKMLSVRFPDLDIEASQPRLFVNSEYNLPQSGKLQDLPEVPQAYAVFGSFAVPLTITSKASSELTLLANLGETLLSDKVLSGDLTLYGILSVDQIAGAWVQVIVEATGLTSRQARLLITQAIQLLKRNA